MQLHINSIKLSNVYKQQRVLALAVARQMALAIVNHFTRVSVQIATELLLMQ